MRGLTPLLLLASLLLAGFAAAQKEPAAAPAPTAPPNVAGNWTGTWGVFAPGMPLGAKEPSPATAGKEQTMPRQQLDCCVVTRRGGRFEATFQGECGRPYKYTVRMTGRQIGAAVLFKGTADLGEQDGGVYDWIGRASDKEFVGFFTSQKYTGSFRLTR